MSVDFVFGRALICCDNPRLLFVHPSTLSDGNANDYEQLNDMNIHLLFPLITRSLSPHASHLDKFLTSNCDVSGILILEGLINSASVSDTSVDPLGLMIFCCDAKVRDEIIYHRQEITYYDLICRGLLRIVWFPSDKVIEYARILGDHAEGVIPYTTLFEMIVDDNCFIRYEKRHACESLFISYIMDIGVLRMKLKQNFADYFPDNVLRLDAPTLMQCLLFFHIKFRCRRKGLPTLRVWTNTLCDTVAKNNKIILSSATTGYMQHDTCGDDWRDISRALAWTDIYPMYLQFKAMTAKKQQNIHRAHEIGDVFAKFRKRSLNSKLFASEKIKKIKHELIQTIPTNFYDDDTVNNWLQTALPSIQTQLLDNKSALRSVCEQVQIKWFEDGARILFRQYGNLTEAIGGVKYMCQNIKTLTSTNTKSLLYRCTSPTAVRLDVRIHEFNKSRKLQDQRLLDAYNTYTPIWSRELAGGSRDYYRIVPLSVTTPTADSSTCSRRRTSTSVYELIETHMYGADRKTHELINSCMHCQMIAADIDIKMLPEKTKSTIQQQDQEQQQHTPAILKHIYMQLIDNTNYLFERLFEGMQIRRHLIFVSKNDDKRSAYKIGIHHHILLPLGIAFSVNACRQFLTLLNNSTVEINGEYVSNFYDSQIYPRSDGTLNDLHMHSLRGPGQSKAPNTSRALECVYNSKDGSSDFVTHQDTLIHGVQYDNDDKPVRYGRLVVALLGAVNTSDSEWYGELARKSLSRLISQSSSKIGDIVRDLNDRHFIFSPYTSVDNTDQLLCFLNELYFLRYSQGQQRLHDWESRHLFYLPCTDTVVLLRSRTASMYLYSCFQQNNGHLTTVDIQESRRRISGCERLNENTLSVKYCLTREHRHGYANRSRVEVVCSAKMNRFLLHQLCFKCRGKSAISLDRTVTFLSPFIFPSLRSNVRQFLLQHTCSDIAIIQDVQQRVISGSGGSSSSSSSSSNEMNTTTVPAAAVEKFLYHQTHYERGLLDAMQHQTNTTVRNLAELLHEKLKALFMFCRVNTPPLVGSNIATTTSDGAKFIQTQTVFVGRFDYTYVFVKKNDKWVDDVPLIVCATDKDLFVSFLHNRRLLLDSDHEQLYKVLQRI